MRSARTDHDRWLTDAGRQTVTEVGKTLTQLNLQYSCIYTSPLVRAVQTAEILAMTQPGFHGPLEVHPALQSEVGSTAEALAPLDHAAEEDRIVMVTHMPKIGVLAARLGQLPRFPAFDTAAVCLVRIEDGRGRFQWMLDPETLELKRP